MAWSTGPDYQRVRVAVGDCAPEISETIKRSLNSRGIADIVLCDTTESLYRALDEKVVDLLIYDYHLLGARFVEAMQKIRRKEVGRNPFLTIIATIRESSAETVHRLIEGGVDELLRSPASTDRIFATIDKSIRRRKPFIVTYDYVGPARSVARRDRTQDIAPVRVPNPLKSRLIERASDQDIDIVVFKAAALLAQRQLLSCGAEIDALAHRVADTCNGVAGGDDNRAMRGALIRIGAVADDLRHRAIGTPMERISDLIDTLISLAQRIIEAPVGRAAVEVRLLAQLAAAVRRVLSADEGTQPAIREITEAVGDFARRAAAAPAQFSTV
jgi:DNA-binding response OmpR family regulator